MEIRDEMALAYAIRNCILSSRSTLYERSIPAYRYHVSVRLFSCELFSVRRVYAIHMVVGDTHCFATHTVFLHLLFVISDHIFLFIILFSLSRSLLHFLSIAFSLSVYISFSRIFIASNYTFELWGCQPYLFFCARDFRLLFIWLVPCDSLILVYRYTFYFRRNRTHKCLHPTYRRAVQKKMYNIV